MTEAASKSRADWTGSDSGVTDDDLNGDLVRKLGELAAGVVHEVRNPLQTVRAFIQAMGRISQDENILKNYMPLIIDELNRADLLLEDFLHFTHQQPLKLCMQDLTKICHDTVTLMQSGAYLRGQTIVEKYQTDIPMIKADGNRLRQVLLNLILNAMDAGKEGDRVEIEVAAKNGKLYLTVADTGPGLSDDEVRNIFTPFYTTKKHGTGLGLPLCMHIAQVHGGAITVDSQLGKGSAFSLVLPLNS